MKQLVRLVAGALSICLVLSTLPLRAQALSGSEFQAGRIIDNSKFFSEPTMSISEIQAFLNSKVPVCDTWGTKMHSSGMTRAEYSASRGVSTPFICLKEYRDTVTAKSAEAGLCNGLPAGSGTAAEIIFWVSQSCGINPQVLLVLLQKEQSLVTDDWPWPIQYRSATGYGCPDTAPCDSLYYGFFNQVWSAARQFKRYGRDSHLFNYRAGINNFIQYHPNTACGGSTVFIQNQATAGLYNYTPYQPNPAALNNLYGTGDGCSAYGNRNFWRIFHDWFGSTISNCIYPQTDGNSVFRLYHPVRNNHFLTTDPSEVCLLTSQMGYLYDDKYFTSELPASGTTYIYRLEKNGRYLYTSSAEERDNAVQNYGFRFEGIAFNGLDPAANPTSARPVYRLADPKGGYFFTISAAERDMAANQMGMRIEGVGYYVRFDGGEGATSPLYRLVHKTNGVYFYTLSATERDNAAELYGYRYEGVGFSGFNKPNTYNLPVYRLAGKRGYIFTTSLQERAVATSLGYRPEGVSYYGFTANSTNGNPLFRLVNNNGTYLYTISVTERDSAVSMYGYRYEGTGFNTP